MRRDRPRRRRRRGRIFFRPGALLDLGRRRRIRGPGVQEHRADLGDLSRDRVEDGLELRFRLLHPLVALVGHFDRVFDQFLLAFCDRDGEVDHCFAPVICAVCTFGNMHCVYCSVKSFRQFLLRQCRCGQKTLEQPVMSYT